GEMGCVRGHFPAFRAAALDSLRFAHANRKFSRRFSVPQTTALALAARPRLRMTRSEIAIHEFGRHRHHDQSKNPAHHTTGSKLTPQRAVLKCNLDAIHRSVMQTMADGRTTSVDVRLLLQSPRLSWHVRCFRHRHVDSARRLARLSLNLT